MITKGYLLAAIGLAGMLATAIPAHAKLDIDYAEIAKRQSQNAEIATTQPVQQNTVIAQVAPQVH